MCRSKTPIVHATSGDAEPCVFSLTDCPGPRDRNHVTLKTEFGRHIRFQIDTGASVNVIPADVYKNVTGDRKLMNIDCSYATNITAYGKYKWPALGAVVM